jgi:hypothetical protein
MNRMKVNKFFGRAIFPYSKAERKTLRQIQGIKGLIQPMPDDIDWQRFDSDPLYRQAIKQQRRA